MADFGMESMAGFIDTEVDFFVQARGSEHVLRIIEELKRAGFHATLQNR